MDFDIQNLDDLKLEDILCSSSDDLLRRLGTTRNGLSTAEASKRLDRYGRNDIAMRKRRSIALEFLAYFKNPLIVILIVAAVISGILGDGTDMLIIFAIIFMSVFLDFIQEYRAGKAAEELRKRIQTTTTVLRDGKSVELSLAEVVPGDMITLSAGEIVPADARLLSAKDLFAHQSVLTGESIPLEKHGNPLKPEETSSIASWTNYVFMGSSILSGTGLAVIVKTGASTEYGKIIKRVVEKKPETEFDTNLKKFGNFLFKVTILLVGFVFLVDAIAQRGILDSLLFAIALSVGLTPDLLPMIISVNLSKAAAKMAKKKVIVKRLNSIQNFGSMDTLCTDKTGTLTDNKVAMILHIDIDGTTNDKVFVYSYINSYFQTGMKSPLDDAILDFKDKTKVRVDDYKKRDEIPFDFTRKRISIIVHQGADAWMFTKGAPDEVEKICSHYEFDEQVLPIDDQTRKRIAKTFEEMSADGYRMLGIAYKKNPQDRGNFDICDEFEMVFLGFVAFLDPPKESTKAAVKQLKDRGVELKILTGDNELVTKKVCKELDIEIKGILLGNDIIKLSSEELSRVVDNVNIFARVTPSQKERIIAAFKHNGHVIGFMGDGINDTPPMKAADVSISVENAVDIAKETADIILLEKDLRVLADGVLEGRVTFGNMEKYMFYTISSNFGTMFSAAAGSLFVPFLPMLPTQVLANNLLNDVAQIPLPLDNVDPEFISKPKRLHISFISRFMVAFGPLSSIFDIAMFLTMFLLFSPILPNGTLDTLNVSRFQTAFFIETLSCQLIIIFVIRTRHVPFWKTRPNKFLAFSIIAILAFSIALLYIPAVGGLFGFVPLPPLLFGILAIYWVIYITIVELMKRVFYKKYGHLG